MRTPIPEEVSAEVMFQHDRTCCICNEPGKRVQIHHIDEDPSNHALSNLAVMCLADHDETQIKGGFGKKLKLADVIRHRDDWLRRVRERREMADKLAIDQMAIKERPPEQTVGENAWQPPSAAMLAIYINNLPDVLKHARDEAERIWTDGDSKDVVFGTHLVVSVVEQSWVQLAIWFDPQHFNGQSARDYMSKLLADRNVWNRAIVEPKDYGWRARTGTIETLERTLVDAQDAVEQSVRTLASAYLKEFDFNKWKKRWDKSKYIG